MTVTGPHSGAGASPIPSPGVHGPRWHRSPPEVGAVSGRPVLATTCAWNARWRLEQRGLAATVEHALIGGRALRTSGPPTLSTGILRRATTNRCLEPPPGFRWCRPALPSCHSNITPTSDKAPPSTHSGSHTTHPVRQTRPKQSVPITIHQSYQTYQVSGWTNPIKRHGLREPSG